MVFQGSTLVDMLEDAGSAESFLGYTVIEGPSKELFYSFAKVVTMAKAIAVEMYVNRGVNVGDRVFVVCTPGITFVTAYFGCICCGAVAVPLIPPYDKLSAEKLERIIEDSRPTAFLTDSTYLKSLQKARFSRYVPGGISSAVKQGQALSAFEFQKLPWLEVDKVDKTNANHWQRPGIDGSSLVMLQYTSGSTSHPKGNGIYVGI